MENVAKNINKIIKERGHKQCDVAAEAGYTVKTFNNMLRGRKRILADDIPQICDVLGITPNELYEYSGRGG